MNEYFNKTNKKIFSFFFSVICKGSTQCGWAWFWSLSFSSFQRRHWLRNKLRDKRKRKHKKEWQKNKNERRKKRKFILASASELLIRNFTKCRQPLFHFNTFFFMLFIFILPFRYFCVFFSSFVCVFFCFLFPTNNINILFALKWWRSSLKENIIDCSMAIMRPMFINRFI